MSSSEVAAILATAKPGQHRVDKSLYLQVREHGSRSWLFRYKRNGRSHWLGLGPLDLVSAATAKKEAMRLRLVLLDGGDPVQAREAERERRLAARRRGGTGGHLG